METTRSGAPLPQVQEVITDSATAQFGDGRHDAFELVLAHALDDSVNKFHLKSTVNTFLRRVTLIYQQVEQLINRSVSEAQLIFICLPGPQVG